MFEWLFGKKKTETKVTQEVKITGDRNHVVQKTTVTNRVDQRGAKAKGDIIGGNKYSTYRQETQTTTYDLTVDLLNPLNPFSPINPMNQSQAEPEQRVHTHSYDSGSSHSHSHDSSSSSSYDSGSSTSFDSGGHH